LALERQVVRRSWLVSGVVLNVWARTGHDVACARALGETHPERRPGFGRGGPAGAATRYLPVGRCAAPREWADRACPPVLAPRSAPCTGGGVRRTSNCRARSSGLFSVRVLSASGCTVRNTGPRARSTTATMTFELLGVSNTIPSSSRPPSATFTSSPAPIDSIAASVLGKMILERRGSGTGQWSPATGLPTSWVRCI
jgi:hypothetical protein